MKAKRPWAQMLMWIARGLLTLFAVYWLFLIAVKPIVHLLTTPSLFLDTVYWTNYVEVFPDETQRGYMGNSVIISTGNAFFVTTLAFFACYALSRYDLAGKENIFFWTITHRMAPAAVFLLPFP